MTRQERNAYEQWRYVEAWIPGRSD
jgi:hypothetical protein